MAFEEKFRKYKNGELSEEEAAQVEEELEKMQVLLEYMDESIDEELFAPEPGSLPGRKDCSFASEEGEADSSNQETNGRTTNHTDRKQASPIRKMQGGRKAVKEENPGQNLSKIITKAINRKMRRVAFGTGFIVLLLLTVVLMGLSPFLDAVCYDPTNLNGKGNESERNFELTMATYMEMMCGAKGFSYTNVLPEGFGRYAINVRTQINSKDKIYPMELVRNRLYETDISWDSWDLPFNAFSYILPNPEEVFCGKSEAEVKESLRDLPDQVKIQAAISFKDVKNLEELTAFMERYPSDYMYVPYCVDEDQKAHSFSTVAGFRPYMVGFCYADIYDQKEYPYLTLDAYGGKESVPAEVLQQHVESMLKFMEKDDTFDKIFVHNRPGEDRASWTERYTHILEYVQQEGVQSYGVVVNATKEELLNLMEDKTVDGAYLMDSYLILNRY